LSQTINKQIIDELAKRGLRTIRGSNTRRSVLRFEQNTCSQGIFHAISARPFLRILMDLLAREKLQITKEDVQQLLKESSARLKDIMKESPDKNLLCRNCFETIHRHNIDLDRKPSGKAKCPKCNAPNELGQCKEKNDWSFPITSITSYLDQMIELRVLNSNILGSCTRCMRSTSIQQPSLGQINSMSQDKLRKFIEQLYCQECGRFYDLGEIYNLTDLVAPLWIKENIWLEWYVKKALTNYFPTAPVEQGLIIGNEEVKQIDVVLLKNEKVITFECKALSLRKNASFNEVSDALKLLDLSDKVFLVTTTLLKDNDKKSLLNRGEGKLKVIEAGDIEEMSDIIEKN